MNPKFIWMIAAIISLVLSNLLLFSERREMWKKEMASFKEGGK